MKFTKIIALALSLIMVVAVLAACDKGGEDDTTTPADGTTTADPANVTIKVGIVVKDIDGNAVYETDSYTYIGKTPNLIKVLEDYLYMEKDIELVYDGIALSAVGSVEAGAVTSHDNDSGEDKVVYNTYWWYKINGKDGSLAPDEYIAKDGDKIEFYLAKKAA